jgi:hypothetical protein
MLELTHWSPPWSTNHQAEVLLLNDEKEHEGSSESLIQLQAKLERILKELSGQCTRAEFETAISFLIRHFLSMSERKEEYEFSNDNESSEKILSFFHVRAFLQAVGFKSKSLAQNVVYSWVPEQDVILVAFQILNDTLDKENRKPMLLRKSQNSLSHMISFQHYSSQLADAGKPRVDVLLPKKRSLFLQSDDIFFTCDKSLNDKTSLNSMQTKHQLASGEEGVTVNLEASRKNCFYGIFVLLIERIRISPRKELKLISINKHQSMILNR